ncbi:MAG TPA: autotransporter outer membrane beta-barrel domain-containing protein [Beijerinckiaceae bacterium]|nr:autotransporter outer membrane beta-barrel domain-containing protein [Beijerinckiaceae bacterium]
MSAVSGRVSPERALRAHVSLIAAAILSLAPMAAAASDARLGKASSVLLDIIDSRLDKARSGPVPESRSAAPGAQAARAWSTGYGYGSRTGAGAGGATVRGKGGGGAAGIEHAVDPTLVVGIAAGVARERSSGNGLRSDMSTVSTGAYVAWSPFDGWELDGFLGNHWVEIETTRGHDGAAAPFRGDARAPGISGLAGAGYRLRSATSMGEGFVKPFVSLAYVSHDRRGYTDSGPSGPRLEFPSKTYERTAGNIGLAAGVDVNAGGGWTVRPEMRVAWSHYISNPTSAVPAFLWGAPAIIRDPEPGRDGAVIDVELTGWKHADLQLFAGYTGEFRSNEALHQGRAGVRLNW